MHRVKAHCHTQESVRFCSLRSFYQIRPLQVREPFFQLLQVDCAEPDGVPRLHGSKGAYERVGYSISWMPCPFGRDQLLLLFLKGNDRICYSFKEINTATELLHLTGLVKQVAFFDESENLATTELQQPGGVSSQFSTPYAIEFDYFRALTLEEADAYTCYLLLTSI